MVGFKKKQRWKCQEGYIVKLFEFFFFFFPPEILQMPYSKANLRLRSFTT